MKGRPAVVVYTLVEPELRDAMRALCRRAKLHYCDILGHPIEAVAKVSGPGGADEAAARGRRSNDAYFRRMSAIEFAVKFDDGVGSRAARRGHRPRRRVAHVEDAALDLPRLPRLQDRERADRQGHQAADGAVRRSTREGRRADDRRGAARRDPRASASRWMRGDHKLPNLVEIYEELDDAAAIHASSAAR